MPARLFLIAASIIALLAPADAFAFSHYGRTTVTLTFNNKPLPPASYVPIALDGGDVWYTSEYTDAVRIPKSSVTLVPNFQFDQPLGGRLNRNSPIYRWVANSFSDPNSLEQTDKDQFNRVLSADKGTEFRIVLKQGDDFIVAFNPGTIYFVSPGRRDAVMYGRFPTTAVDIISGSLASAKIDAVPLLPATGLKTHEVYVPPQAVPNNSGGFVIFFVALIILLSVSGVAIFLIVKWAKNRKVKQAERAGPYPHGFTDELKARFPSNVIYFVPESIKDILKLSSDNSLPVLEEQYYDTWWNPLLKNCPTPPRNDAESHEAETAFLRAKVSQLTVNTSSGRPRLLPKQEILGGFQRWEKWIFREYYAATGIVHKTIAQEVVRHILEIESAHAMKTYGDATSLSNNQKRHEIEKATDARDRFVRESLPAHYKKWGEWYFFHVQQTFNDMYQAEADYGPRSATTPKQHPAQDELSYKPKI